MTTTTTTTITRAIPDIRSTDLARSRAFYVDLLGFDVCMEQHGMVMFCSPSHSWVQITLNGDDPPLPSGFLVDVDTADDAARLHDEAIARGLRIVEPLNDKPQDVREFSVLDPSGTRVTVLAHIGRTVRADAEDTEHPVQIVRAIPTVRSRDLVETRDFYVEYLGFEECMERDHMLMFCSRSHPRVQVIAHDQLAHPPGFDLDVGDVDRVNALHAQSVDLGYTVVSPPSDIDDAVRAFVVLDPNGTGVSVLAHLT